MDVQRGGIYLYEPPTSSASPQSALLITSGSEQAGLRPYVIMSRDVVNAGKPTAVAVPLTSKIKKANAYRIFLPVGEMIPEPGSSFGFTDSVALCDHVRVLDLNRVRKKIGTLSTNAVLGVALGLAFIFDIR